ncbi:ferritin-like domain-containing protein [Krasilnikovia sp. MM14-A1004]|uniref:ferritin-like domain-containing protein n=1 Tax=Krasilnikovia sp. MM14-A1004 TaxID=3373541 RepID=UPI00399CDB25
MDFAYWVRRFEDAAAERDSAPEPPWGTGGPLPDALIASLQRFQAGEDGDGVSLIAKSARAGDADYLAAVRMFVAEEQRHARLLERVLAGAGAPTLTGHWTDTVFVVVRRAFGLRLELMTLMVAEVVALRYYRALRDGAPDPLLSEVAGRILADEQRHVPFHVARLRQGFGRLPRLVRALAAGGWWLLMTGATLVVAVDHAGALRRLRLSPVRFAAEVLALFRPIVSAVLGDGREDARIPVSAVADPGLEPGDPSS